MKRLEGKVALITGGTSGIGKVTVERFLEEGAKIVFTGRDEEKGQDIVSELGENTRFIRQDVTDLDDWDKVIEFAVEEFGKIDILANIAGIGINKTIQDLEYEEFHKVIDIDLNSIFYSTKKIAPVMEENGGGSIINISSLSGIRGSELLSAYNAAKFGVRGITKSSAAEYAKLNIRVNSILPGPIKTEIFDTFENGDQMLEEYEKQVPLGKVGDPVDIANAALFLASDESKFVTGSDLIIDGGMSSII